ncbi:mitochondrial large subunit ribosomal protein-domain-containing protein [Trametes punicea]|nr:mitochondrial large subunit ribosomal protein-domain-containing protein [Trametes punicea]
MLRSLVPRLFAPSTRQARLFSSQLAPAPSEALPPPPHAQSHSAGANPSPAPSLPYRVRRNTRGSIPVYTDIRNSGTRVLVLIRNVEGNIEAFMEDLQKSLFPAGSDEAARLKISTTKRRHVALSGGRWKNDVVRWLTQRGF